jgi:hypothetical protein
MPEENFKPKPRQPTRRGKVTGKIDISADTTTTLKDFIGSIVEEFEGVDPALVDICFSKYGYYSDVSASFSRPESDAEVEKRHKAYEARMQDWAEWCDANPGAYEEGLKKRREGRNTYMNYEKAKSSNNDFIYTKEEPMVIIELPDGTTIAGEPSWVDSLKMGATCHVNGKEYCSYEVYYNRNETRIILDD